MPTPEDFYGWLDPKGRHHAVTRGEHELWAKAYIEKIARHLKHKNSLGDGYWGDVLIAHGWCLIDASHGQAHDMPAVTSSAHLAYVPTEPQAAYIWEMYTVLGYDKAAARFARRVA